MVDVYGVVMCFGGNDVGVFYYIDFVGVFEEVYVIEQYVYIDYCVGCGYVVVCQCVYVLQLVL